jgi:hypothetical protein
MDNKTAHADFEAMYDATREANVEDFTRSLATHTRAAACVLQYDGLLRTTHCQIRNQLVTTWNLQSALEQVVDPEAVPPCGGAIAPPDCTRIGTADAYCQLVIQLQTTYIGITNLMVFTHMELDNAASTGPSTHDTIVASPATPHQHSRHLTATTLGTAATVAVRNLANDQRNVESWIDAQRANNIDMAAGIAKLHEAQKLHLVSVYGPDDYKATAKWLYANLSKDGEALLYHTRRQYNTVKATLLFKRLDRLSSAATAAVEKLGPNYSEVHTPLN